MSIISYEKDYILEKIKEVEDNQSYFIFKDFISKDSLLKWDRFLESMYEVASEDTDELLKSQINKDQESLIGNLIVSSGIYFNFKSKKEGFKMFPQIQDAFEDLPVFFYGPKISLGPYFIGPHQDSWHGATLQCEGRTMWTLKHEKFIVDTTKRFSIDEDNANQITLYPGDFLYFSQKLFHQVEVDGPRANLLFNSTGISDILNKA